MIFEQYSYKVKVKVLAVIFILLSCAAYKRSFSKLISTFNEYNEIKSKNNKLKSGTVDIDVLKAELKKINKIIGKEAVDKEKIQQDIIGFAIKHNRTSIFDLKAIHKFKEDDFVIYTNQLDVTGDIDDLLKLAYDFEKNFPLSKVASMKLYTLNKENKKSTILHLKLIFQNYENNY